MALYCLIKRGISNFATHSIIKLGFLREKTVIVRMIPTIPHRATVILRQKTLIMWKKTILIRQTATTETIITQH